ncbi:hypothetical protein B0J11DRAFT_530168 [Dendryphion nanum]|uniref:Uncharacterized protein n=1 Tax=Dendryphion nanum TaxID=256645 RepID=A0A9P9DQL0_9PLEO|nr:hypothetical protein B0J11DRAFT_530168 [Dendryphion nanum]
MRSPTPTRNSKPKTLRKKLTLLSLSILGFSATPTLAQEPSTTSTWGLPFSVEGPSSTERLVPSSALASSAASVASSQISAIVSSESVSGSGSVPVISGSRTRSLQVSRSAGLVSDSISSSRVGTSFTATLPNTTMSPLTVSTPIVVLHSSTVLISTTATTTGTGSVLESTGSAVPGPRPYVRMGALGVIVGAAGVVMA